MCGGSNFLACDNGGAWARVQSAAEGNFNMLRIWGGAIFEPRAFYDAADEFGVLMYHDMQCEYP